MTASEIIAKILNASSCTEIFPDLSNWSQSYKEYMKLIHPDLCSEPGHKEAAEKLNVWKEELSNGRYFTDDAGSVKFNLNTCEFTGKADLLKRSLDNYRKLTTLSDPASIHFRKYLPVSGDINEDGKLVFTLPARAVPLCSLHNTDQKHVNWILSRMLEFVSWLNQSGFCHAGINPNSIFVIPENHGILCMSFYHMTELDSPLKTVSARFSSFYPADLFTHKKASSDIDIDLAKRTAIYLLGDRSGSGVVLRKTHEEEIVDFLLKHEYDPFESYSCFRKILKKYFDTKQFHSLTI
jgi:hypothetical protein